MPTIGSQLRDVFETGGLCSGATPTFDELEAIQISHSDEIVVPFQQETSPHFQFCGRVPMVTDAQSDAPEMQVLEKSRLDRRELPENLGKRRQGLAETRLRRGIRQ